MPLTSKFATGRRCGLPRSAWSIAAIACAVTPDLIRGDALFHPRCKKLDPDQVRPDEENKRGEAELSLRFQRSADARYLAEHITAPFSSFRMAPTDQDFLRLAGLFLQTLQISGVMLSLANHRLCQASI